MADRLPAAVTPSGPPSPDPGAAPLLALQRQLQGNAPQTALQAHTLTAIAQWRLACGDGTGAARWRRWSLQPPPRTELVDALRALLLRAGHPEAAQALGGVQGWEAVQLALALGEGERAEQLQEQAFAEQLPLPTEQCLQLISTWRSRQAHRPALELVMRMPELWQSPPLCHLAAFLQHQLDQPAAAAEWWERSLELAPDQLAVVSHRARNALALGELGRAEHLAQTLVECDPSHPTGHAVLLSALQQVSAKASLRQLLASRHHQGLPAEPALQAALERWWQPRQRRQHTWKQALPPHLHALPLQLLAPPQPIPAEALRGHRQIGLLASRDGLELAGSLDPSIADGEVWDLGSREPLTTTANLKMLLPPGWQLRRWHQWQEQRHGPMGVMVISRHLRRPQRPTSSAATVWHRTRDQWIQQRDGREAVTEAAR